MKQKKGKSKQKKIPQERPIDPSQNYEDMIGDSYGMTGITTGSAEQSSAEPTDIRRDVDTGNLPGGIRQGKQTQPTGIPRTAVSQKEYNKSIGPAMSKTATETANDIGSENETTSPSDDSIGGAMKKERKKKYETSDEDELRDDQPHSQTDTPASPAITGEQSVSGDMPDDESDDDTLENAHAVGEQKDEDLEHPEELDIARDIDESEEYTRTH